MLALLHEDDRWHVRCVETFSRFRLPWATSVAVLTEFFYLASRGPHSVATAWHFLRSGTIILLTIDDADLPALEELMRKCRSADGLRRRDPGAAGAARIAEHRVTIDHDALEFYRVEGRRRFRIVPEP